MGDVDDYLANLPSDRRTALTALRATINANLPAGFEEGIQFGMPSWYIPLARYPTTYNGQPLMIAGIASQKTHMAIYMMTVYGDPDLEAWFRGAFAAAGKKLDMGKSCVRFKTLDALPLDIIGQAIAKVGVDAYIAKYEAVKGAPPKREAAAKPAPKKKPATPRKR